jgi:hypothetical protein
MRELQIPKMVPCNQSVSLFVAKLNTTTSIRMKIGLTLNVKNVTFSMKPGKYDISQDDSSYIGEFG